MLEHDVFEARLHAAVRRYVGQTSSDLDPVAFAHAVATAGPRRYGRRLAFGPTVTCSLRLAWLLLLVALLAALMVGALLAGVARPPHAWQRVNLPGGGAIADIVEGPDGFVAAGSDAQGFGAFWFSSDCRHWMQASASGRSVDEIGSLTTWRSGYAALAVGGGVAAWTSTDGRTWTQLPAEPVAGTEADDLVDAFAADLAGGSVGLVAVGAQQPYGSSPHPHAIWISTDGVKWRQVDPVDGSVQGYFYGLNAVAAAGPGFVAVGEADSGIPIWTSRDGTTWTRVQPTASASPGSNANAVQWSRLRVLVRGWGGSMLAFGVDRTGYIAWTSADGLVWTRETLSGLPDYGDSTIVRSIVATTEGYVATGLEPGTGADGSMQASAGRDRGVLWTSNDGRWWTRLPAPPMAESGGFERALTCGADLLVSVGGDEAATWVLPGGAGA